MQILLTFRRSPTANFLIVSWEGFINLLIVFFVVYLLSLAYHDFTGNKMIFVRYYGDLTKNPMDKGVSESGGICYD